MKERKKEKRRKEGKKERRKEGKKERRKEGKKERKKEKRKKERKLHFYFKLEENKPKYFTLMTTFEARNLPLMFAELSVRVYIAGL